MPEKRANRRGPRRALVDGDPSEAREEVPGVLMPEIIGVVLRLAREGMGVRQVAVAKEMGVPQSTISKLEHGTITQGVYHLDLFARAISRQAKPKDRWQAWRLLRRATEIAAAIEDDKGLGFYWLSRRQAPDMSAVSPRKLEQLVEAHW